MKKIKTIFFPVIFSLFVLCLIIFSGSNLYAIKGALSLWAMSVVPSLFPFFVATELLLHTNITKYFNLIFKKFMRPLFNIPGEASFAFFMGLISGYPIGAKIACEFRKNKICSKVEAERLLSFTNNSSPLFIITTVGISMFGNSTIGILLFISHFLASISVGFIFRFWHNKTSNDTNIIYQDVYIHSNTYTNFSNLGEILAESIEKALLTIFLIGGFIVIFSCIISILKSSNFFQLCTIVLAPFFNILHISPNFIEPVITGLFEITSGINLITNVAEKNLSINILLTSFVLGTGGLSVFFQVFSMVSKSDLSIKPYIYGKILQATLSVFYTFIFICTFPFFNFNLS